MIYGIAEIGTPSIRSASSEQSLQRAEQMLEKLHATAVEPKREKDEQLEFF